VDYARYVYAFSTFWGHIEFDRRRLRSHGRDDRDLLYARQNFAPIT